MYFILYIFNLVYIFIGCIDFSSWLGLACIVLFLIFTVHSYVASTLYKLIDLFAYSTLHRRHTGRGGLPHFHWEGVRGFCPSTLQITMQILLPYYGDRFKRMPLQQ